MPEAEVNGISLHYYEQGSGAPMLLIMGLATQMIAWPPDLVGSPPSAHRRSPMKSRCR